MDKYMSAIPWPRRWFARNKCLVDLRCVARSDNSNHLPQLQAHVLVHASIGPSQNDGYVRAHPVKRMTGWSAKSALMQVSSPTCDYIMDYRVPQDWLTQSNFGVEFQKTLTYYEKSAKSRWRSDSKPSRCLLSFEELILFPSLLPIKSYHLSLTLRKGT